MASINERKAFRLSVIFILLIAVIACMIISLIWGSTPVSLAEIWRTLWSDELTDTASQIIWNIRLPRNIVAALVGACLAVSGAILQAVMKNPLADPQIVGVSSGAGLAGVIVLILFPGYDYIVPLVAFLGAMGAALMVYALAWKNGVRPSRIILAGVAVAAFLGSGISALLVFYGDRVQGALLWMVGGLSARSWPQVEVLFPYAMIGLFLGMCFPKFNWTNETVAIKQSSAPLLSLLFGFAIEGGVIGLLLLFVKEEIFKLNQLTSVVLVLYLIVCLIMAIILKLKGESLFKKMQV